MTTMEQKIEHEPSMMERIGSVASAALEFTMDTLRMSGPAHPVGRSTEPTDVYFDQTRRSPLND